MFRLEGPGAGEAACKFKEAIEALPGRIEQLVSAEVGVNDGPDAGNWTLALTAECRDYEDLAVYAAHPLHLDCVAIIKPFMAARACVDYIVKE